MADIVTSRVFVDGEKGITAAKLNDIVASSVIQPAFYTSKPTAGTADPADIALILKVAPTLRCRSRLWPGVRRKRKSGLRVFVVITR